MSKKAGYGEGWFRAGVARLVIVLLVLGVPALGPRMARADTHTSTGTLPGESDRRYEFDADTSALTFSGAITCSGKDYGFQANGKLKGLAITVTDFTVTIAGQDVKIGINKTYQVPFDTKNVSKLDDDFQKALKSYDDGCSKAANPGERCQFSNDPGPTEAGSDQASGSGSGNSGDSSNSQEEVCPGLQKIKGYLIVGIPSYLKGKLLLGSNVPLIAPGGALMPLPLGASLSHPFMPVISTSGSVLLPAGGIFGAGLEIDAKGGNVPGSDAVSYDGTVPSDKLGGTAYDDPTNPLQVGGWGRWLKRRHEWRGGRWRGVATQHHDPEPGGRLGQPAGTHLDRGRLHRGRWGQYLCARHGSAYLFPGRLRRG